MSQTVVEQLLIEMKARTDQAEARLAAVERAQKRVTDGARVAGTGASQMGARYAAAGQQMASAAESAARAGSLAGDAGKQMIQQGAAMAMMFGTAGPIVGAVAIAGVAIYEMFNRTRREMEETERKAKEVLDNMQNTGDTRGLMARARQLEFGTPSEGGRDGLRHLRAELARAEEEHATVLRQRNAFLYKKTKDAIDDLKAKIAPLEKEQQDILRRIQAPGPVQEGTRDPITTTAKSPERLQAEAEQAQRKELERIGREFGPILSRGNALVSQLQQAAAAARQLGEETDAFLRGLSESMVDDLEFALAKFDEEFAAAERTGTVTPEQKRARDARRAAMVAEIEAARQLDQMRPAFKEMDALLEAMERRRSANAADGVTFAPTPEELAQLEEFRAQFRAWRDDDTRHSKAREEAAKRVSQAEGQVATHRTKATQLGAQIAGHIKNAAHAGALLASALGGANSEAAQLLSTVGNIADGVGDMFKAASDAKGWGKLFSTKEGLTSAIPIAGQIVGGLGALGGLFGDSPAEQERKRLTKELTESLRDLTDRIGQLDVRNTGQNRTAIVAAARAVDEALGAAGDFSVTNKVRRQMLDKLLAESGLTFGDFRDQVRAMTGVEIGDNPSSEQIRLIMEAASSAGVAFETLQQEWRVLGTSAQDQLEQFTRFITGQASDTGRAVKRALAGLDLSTQQGRDAAVEAIRQAYAPGGDASRGTISAELAQQFISLLQGAGVQDPGTGGYNISRTITEATGGRIDGRLATSNVWLEQIAASTAATAAALGAQVPGLAAVLSAPPIVTTPAITTPVGSGRSGAPVIAITIHQTLSMPGEGRGAGSAEQAGALLSEAVVRELSQRLAQDAELQRYLRGG